MPAGWLVRRRTGTAKRLANGTLGANPETLAQESLQHFAGAVLRQVRLRELQLAGRLVIRQPLATMTDQGFRGDVHARLEDHAGGHKFSPLRIGYAEDRHLSDRGMVQDDGFDF